MVRVIKKQSMNPQEVNTYRLRSYYIKNDIISQYMSYPHKDIIDQIKLERKRQGLTQTDFANLLGCPQPSIVRIETRKTSPTIGMIQRICDVLGMEITLVKKEKINKHLSICFDMYGCPNRCKHCWLGNLPNQPFPDGYDNYVVELFEPYFKDVTFYSWLREPDFCKNYKERWEKDNLLSSIKPERFELASFYTIVRNLEYVKWLKEVGTKKVQLTFFGLEKTTDDFVGRKGAYQELIKTSEILKQNGIEPRWQIFIYETNKDEVIKLLNIAKKMNIKECFVHEGSCDGNNRKLYDIRINKNNIPEEIKPYYLEYNNILSEKECIELLKDDESHFLPHNDDEIVLYITSDLNVYFNFTSPSPMWKIGNIKDDKIDDIVRRAVEEDIPALMLSKTISIKELVKLYGNANSDRVFSIDDYKMYLLNNYLEDKSNL